MSRDQRYERGLQMLRQIDGQAGQKVTDALATIGRGILYVVDNKAGTITALQTRGWPAGTVFVGEPNDNGNPLIGTLRLSTGQITPLGNTFASPKGLLFLPSGEPDSQR